MSMSIHEIVDKFRSERGLSKNRLPVKDNGNREYVFVNDPMLFIGLAGEIKHQINLSNNRQVFLRGQRNDYPGMIPSLFRNLSDENLKQRWQAYEELIGNVYRDIPRLRRRRKITFRIRSMLAKQVGHDQVYRRSARHENNKE